MEASALQTIIADVGVLFNQGVSILTENAITAVFLGSGAIASGIRLFTYSMRKSKGV